jgi:hypothetical protein
MTEKSGFGQHGRLAGPKSAEIAIADKRPLWVKSGHQTPGSACPLSVGNQASASGQVKSRRGGGLDFLRRGNPCDY